MNKSLEDYVHRLKLEDIIWYVYISLVVFNLISNKYERKYVICKNVEYRNTFRRINIFVFIAAVFIYVFFLINTIKYDSNKNDDKNIRKLNNLSLISTIIFLVGGIINLYIEIQGYNQDLEI